MDGSKGARCRCVSGWAGDLCDIDVDDCVGKPCQNNGTCVDRINGYECRCPSGYVGQRCEITEYWTLQQWTTKQCVGVPWRCFRLQMNECTDTTHTDGTTPNQDNWYGKLTLEGNSYTIDLCWGKKKDNEETCKCDNHFTNAPKLGKNSLGPPTPGLTDSDQCHTLGRITSSRLVNSTGVGKDSVNCSLPSGAIRRCARSLSLALASLSAFAFSRVS